MQKYLPNLSAVSALIRLLPNPISLIRRAGPLCQWPADFGLAPLALRIPPVILHPDGLGLTLFFTHRAYSFNDNLQSPRRRHHHLAIQSK